MSYKDENGKSLFGRMNQEGNIIILYAETGEPVTRLEENVYPIDSDLSAKYEHPEGITLEREDAELIGIDIERTIFESAVEKLYVFRKSFNPDDHQSCVEHGMLLLRKNEADYIEEGYEWNISTDTCRWAIEQAIINRPSGQSMMAAVTEYVEGIEQQVDSFNGIER